MKEPTLTLHDDKHIREGSMELTRRLRDVQDAACIRWFRAAMKKDMGAGAPETDAELVRIGKERGYQCMRIVPPQGDHVFLELRRHGQRITGELMPAPRAVWAWEKEMER